MIETDTRKRAVCRSCRQVRAPYQDGVCLDCIAPPMVVSRAGRLAGRLEDYVELRDEFRAWWRSTRGENPTWLQMMPPVAERLGVTVRTLVRYERLLRERSD